MKEGEEALMAHEPHAGRDRTLRLPSPQSPRHNLPAMLALTIGVLTPIPGVGLLTGPLAMALGALALRASRRRGSRRLAVASFTATTAVFGINLMMTGLLYYLTLHAVP